MNSGRCRCCNTKPSFQLSQFTEIGRKIQCESNREHTSNQSQRIIGDNIKKAAVVDLIESEKVLKAAQEHGVVQWLYRRKGQRMLSLSLSLSLIVAPCSSPPKPNGFSPIRSSRQVSHV
ncbi:uncharacterized protein LOC126603103 [Malus sylvestris]|uniref:uncharacterized protein LOC126603103 n=1 Tax=Malus sylvestris TaxID=3752 RepID=UPI0021ACA272|nr:uncharacterized protein LOC126603103 [Malus sylvestris]